MFDIDVSLKLFLDENHLLAITLIPSGLLGLASVRGLIQSETTTLPKEQNRDNRRSGRI
jgi:hypothetical protein